MNRLIAWIIVAAFMLRLRRPINNVQRWLAERDAPRVQLSQFLTPEQLVRYLDVKFEWRKDKLARWFPIGDWSSHPEVFQARLDEPGGTDGDCDDFHSYCCEQIDRMPGCYAIMRMSCWTLTHGHTTAVFCQDGQLYLIDYDLLKVDSYKHALELVRDRHDWIGELAGWVFETTDMELVACWPRLP